MVRRLASALALLALGLLGTPTSDAAETGSMKVKVVDSDGLGIPGATVTVTSPVLMGAKVETTDPEGTANFARLGPGLYAVETALSGFGTVTLQDVRISVATTQLLDVTLRPAAEKTVTVTADYAVVDTTSASGKQHIQVDRIEALPVGRDYRAYMQLVSGVNVVPNAQGVDTPEDPAGKGGLNYSDRGAQRAAVGKTGSRDNVYYIDGVNITDMSSQTGDLQFNNELIQEQEIISSGVPSEFSGGKGVVANIVTKSGGNAFDGSGNIYSQPKWLVGDFTTDDDRLHVPVDTKYDAAGTFGGPIAKDKAWFFGSAQRVGFSNDIALSASASENGEELPYEQDRNNFFGKVSLSPSSNDQLQASGFWATRAIDGSRNPNILPDRRSVRDTDYQTMQAYYQRVVNSKFIFDARFGRYAWTDEQSPINPDAGPQNNVLHTTTTPAYARQFGGFSSATNNDAGRNALSTEGEWNQDMHRVKMGVTYAKEHDNDEVFFPEGYTLTSVEPALQGETLGDMIAHGFITTSEVRDQLLVALNRNQDATTHFVDTNGDGTVTLAELTAQRFTNLNEHGLNFLRRSDAETGANDVSAKRWSVFMQDDIQLHRNLTLNAGLRIEDNNYVDSEGGTIAHLASSFLPRLGMSWDVTGDAKNKVSMFYGQYLDPISFDMVHFAGNISGRVQNEELFLNDAFYAYRIRGSAEHRDAAFTPNIQDPRAHEFNGTFEHDFGSGLVASVQGYYRKDTNLIEDYDLTLYLDTLVGDPLWGQLALTPEDFGYSGGVPANTNFFLSNLIGAKRKYAGGDFDVRKQFRSGSLVVGQYSYKNAEGNSQSDNNADLQGDFQALDPRNPWMYGTIPGTSTHQLKFFGTYRMKFGLDLGGLLYWNSGTHYTDSEIFLPGQYDIYTNRTIDEATAQYTTTGTLHNPSYYQFDIKLSYTHGFGNIRAQFFLDLYNLTNSQETIEVQAGTGDQLFTVQGEPTRQLSPRRAYVGARVNF